MKVRIALASLSLMTLGATALAQTVDMPTRKAGLWDMVMKMDSPPGMPAMTMQQCTDEATDKAMSTMFGGPQQSQCSEQKMQKSGSTITLDSVCTVAGVKATTRAVFTGDFQSAYTVKVNSKREGGAKSNMMMAAASGETNMVIDAKWTGSCKTGQKPGDIIMPGGIKMNVTDMQQKMRQGGGVAPPPK
jgi:hypothetical protein